MPNLRPVEEFRHTPLIPVSEKELKEFKQKIAERNRRGVYFEIKKDTIYFYSIAALSFSIIAYIFLVVNEKQIMIDYDIRKNKIIKTKAAMG